MFPTVFWRPGKAKAKNRERARVAWAYAWLEKRNNQPDNEMKVEDCQNLSIEKAFNVLLNEQLLYWVSNQQHKLS